MTTPRLAMTTTAADGLPRRCFTVAELERMTAAGILQEDERIELIGGEIVPMSPKGNHHEARLAGARPGRAADDPARARWTLDVTGAVAHQLHWDWAAFQAQPQVTRVTDIHCVTTWSRYDNRWEGLPTRALLDIVERRKDVRFVVLHSSDGYATNLPLEDFRGGRRVDRPFLGGQAAGLRARRSGAADRAASVPLEEREVAEGDHLQDRRRARLLGSPRLP